MTNRFVFHNPHTNIWFKRPLFFYLTKRKSVDKYEYFLDYCVKNNLKIAFLCDGNDFSFGRSFFKGSFAAKCELLLWCYKNNINISKIPIITSVEKLKESDILFSFLYGNFTPIHGDKSNNNRKDKFVKKLSTSKAFKIVHLTHYFFNAQNGSSNTIKAKIDLFVAESNLKNNSSFFEKYYSWYKESVIILPFLPQPRFKMKTSFSERKGKAVATGTLMFPLQDTDFIEFFGNGLLHPMRKEIFDNVEILKPYIDSYITEMNENKENINNYWQYKLFGNLYTIYHKNFKRKQATYFSFNIVDLYNNYKMFIVPEEAVGLPGISFIEGMACGTVFIGKNDPMYSDLGLVSGIHYIGYNGTIEDLIQKISYYQKNEHLLNDISKNALFYIETNLKTENVMNLFFNKIYQLAQKKIANKNSFI